MRFPRLFPRLRTKFRILIRKLLRRPTTPPIDLLCQALRSGEYAQCTGRLALHKGDETSYCCLGVACEVYQQHVGGLVIDATEYSPTYDGERYELPAKVQAWFGFRDSGGRYGLDSLVNLNDSCGKTFAEIADVIESQPKGMFN